MPLIFNASYHIMKTFIILLITLLSGITALAQDWQFSQKLTNPGGGSGGSVAIDGNIAVVGAHSDATYGAAYIYYRDQGTGVWNYVTTLNSDLIYYGEFGISVDISGNNVIIGAPEEEEPVYNRNVGAIYIFNKNMNGIDSWGKVARIQPSGVVDPEENQFGSNVSISGNYAVVGEIGPGNRAFLLYKDQGGVDKWEPMDTLWATQSLGFISAVSIDGDYAVATDTRARVDTGSGLYTTGAAYVFYKDEGGTDQWGESARLVAADSSEMHYFGTSANLNGDLLIIGAPQNDYDQNEENNLSNSGAAYIFQKDHGGLNNWGQVTKLVASDREADDRFGENVSISEDYAIVGAIREDENAQGLDSIYNAGSAYLFYRDEGGENQWGELAKIVASTRSTSNYFGISVDINGDYIIAGTNDENSYMFYNQRQAQNIRIGMIKTGLMSFFFSPGNGVGRAVFVKEGTSGTANPNDSVNYTADPEFGAGDQIETTGWYCVSLGTDTVVAISGLAMDQYYTIMVCEYEIKDGYKIYNTNTAYLNPVTQSSLKDLSDVETSVVEGLLLNTSHKLEYSQNSTDGQDGDWFDCVDGDTPVDFIPGVVYIRQKTIANSRLIRTIPDPANEPLPDFTIDFIDEITNEIVGTDVEFNHDNDFETINMSGIGAVIDILPDTSYYFRFKATDTTFASLTQTLVVPDRPAAPTFTIDYLAEETSGVIANIYEYSTAPDMSGAAAGIFNPISLTPGTDVYLRQISTTSSFSGYIQQLAVPERPPIPLVSLSDRNSATATFMKSPDGTGDRVTTSDGYAYSTDNGSSWFPILDVTTIDASGNKFIIARKNATGSSFKSLSTGNLDSDKPVAVIASSTGCTGTGETIEVQVNIDNGFIYIVLQGESQNSISDLESAITNSKGSKIEITDAGTTLKISTAGLVQGNYSAYAVNNLDSMSDKSSTSADLYQNPAIDLGSDIIKCEETSVTLDAGSGFAAYAWSDAEATTRTIRVTNQGDYAVTVTDDHGCKNSDTLNVKFNIPYQEEKICIVTVDLATSRNIIVWEKTPDAGIVEYNIYRESTVGQFNVIGTISASALSVFRDETGEPWKQPYLYKITSVDTCGNESLVASSKYHKPSFLQYVSSEGGINLSWTDYKIEGVDQIGDFLESYSIYRGTDSTGLSEYDVLGSINNYTDTDPNAFANRYYYRVAANFKDFCSPTSGKKLDDDPYSHSMSNLENNRISVVPGLKEQLSSSILHIYPNPFSDGVTIEFPNPEANPYQLILQDLSGRKYIIINNIRTGKITLEREDLPSGVYLIELKGAIITRQKVIIQ